MPKESRRFRKKKREIFVSLLFFLPFKRRVAIDHWLRGRKELREIRNADVVIVSPPKCGRTWLRTMLSRFFQLRYGLPTEELLGYDNYHRLNPAIPRVRFTHDRYISAYTRDKDSKRDFYDKKVILLVRDPRDVAVSNFFQWKNTVNPFKRRLRDVPDDPSEASPFDYAMNPELGIPRTVRFLNTWAKELPKIKAHLVLRYEDMRTSSTTALRDVLSLIGISATEEEIANVVEFASFENMKKLEKSNAFSSGSRRLMIKDATNPDAFKVRRGKVGGYRDYFSIEELTEIDGLIEETLSPFYGYSNAETDAKA